MKRLFLSLALIVVAATAMAQYPTEMPKYYIFDKDFNDNLFELNLDVRITTGLTKNKSGHLSDNFNFGRGARASLLYLFDPSFRAGMGIGIETYARRDDALPIFLTAQYSPWKSDLRRYLFTNVGYSPQCGKKLLGGWHAEVGVGYKGKTDLINGIKIEVGYNFRALRLTRDGKKLDPTCHALSVGIGFVF